ncbi:hypothetical protein XAP412_270054 [Xanthomonas phaseoli pv. phaseoli]|uniref:Uncharacterized protein n=1 Tax=Xanthomonas campestris pv. phaseoli TaxID=317013 RepID=A0AB38DYS3_XANCH|nr:hypothetical protein XAP6984_330055 [Xanthomonas phaseoli pv. phaseoli]SON82919.1 hypothetical protein XAP412_270054 [Xanthomonas phaseoli pv. phaseoli]SON87129.1 hypothetical protein XAP7430_280055 [Xanthomonas phaseoli pv. phaseoli]
MTQAQGRAAVIETLAACRRSVVAGMDAAQTNRRHAGPDACFISSCASLSPSRSCLPAAAFFSPSAMSRQNPASRSPP